MGMTSAVVAADTGAYRLAQVVAVQSYCLLRSPVEVRLVWCMMLVVLGAGAAEWHVATDSAVPAVGMVCCWHWRMPRHVVLLLVGQ